MVFLFFDKLETLLFVDVPGGTQHAVGPEREFLVSTAPGEADALFDETFTKAQPPGFWFYQEQPELGDFAAGVHQKDTPDPLSFHLSDPASFFGRAVVVYKVRDDSGNQRFEPPIPTVFSVVEHAVTVDDPTHVARLVVAQEKRLGKFEVLIQDVLHRLHGL